MPNLNNYTTEIDPPTFYETLQAAQDSGLVGEEDTVLTLVLAMLRGGLVVMTGPSRAGKDEAVDAAESLFSNDVVYRWPVDDSETAAYYKRGEINQYPVHRFPDLARLAEHHEKVLKAFGEGRDAERNRTDIMAEQMGEDAVEDQVLKCPRTVIAFIATDNENVDLDDYPELRNRALVISVDASEEQTERVTLRKAEERAGQRSRSIDPIRTAEIQDYHGSIPVAEWTENRTNKILNPAAVNIHEQKPMPTKFPEARQDFDRLLEFMETVAMYHYPERLVYENQGTKTLLVAPTDVWEAMTIIGNKMIMSALNLTREDRAILDLLGNSTSNLSKSDIQQALRGQGFNMSDRDVKRSLKSMREKGYTTEHQGSPNTYSLSQFASIVEHDVGINYDELARVASDEVYGLVDDEYGDLYVERFCEGDGLMTAHPFTGQAVDITNDNTLEQMLDTGIKGIEEAMKDDSSLGSGDGDENSGEEEAQRTFA